MLRLHACSFKVSFQTAPLTLRGQNPKTVERSDHHKVTDCPKYYLTIKLQPSRSLSHPRRTSLHLACGELDIVPTSLVLKHNIRGES